MKSILAILTLSSSLAWAHGNLVQQAQGVTTACLDFLMQNEPRNIIRRFKSVTTEMTGNEQFSVTVYLNDGRVFAYAGVGVEGETDADFHWQCSRVER